MKRRPSRCRVISLLCLLPLLFTRFQSLHSVALIYISNNYSSTDHESRFQNIPDGGLSNARTVKQRSRHQSRMMINTTTMIEICRSCQRTKIVATNRTCEMELRHRMKSLPNEWPFWLQTMLQLAKEHGDCRQECHPMYPRIACRQGMIKTVNHGLGFDDLAPILQHAVSPKLSAFAEAIAQNISNGYRLFAYNPTILPYTSDSYVVSFRVSTEFLIPKPAYRNYLIIAILDKNLQVQHNVMFHINRFLGLITNTRGYDDYSRGFDDFRLFYVNGTYILSDRVRVLPLRILVESNDKSPINITEYSNSAYKTEMPPYFGSGIRILTGEMNGIHDLYPGKNFQFIEVESGGAVFVEEWPLSARKGEDTGRRISKLEFYPSIATTVRFNATLQPLGLHNPSPPLEGDEVHIQKSPWRYSGNRGTACCIRIEHEYYSDLTLNTTILSFSHILLGIAHVKSFKELARNDRPWTTHGYLSRFYAILPTIPPIHVAAQSGLFCWPHGDADAGMPSDAITVKTSWLQWKNRTYACPDITYPSGMTTSLSNSSQLIVTYGINDHFSVLAMLSKRDVALRLFSAIPILPRPSETKIPNLF
jgi:hypothetical protein